MEAKIRNLFLRKSSFAQSYDTTVPSQPPIRGLYPALGNGPGIKTLRHDFTGQPAVDGGVEDVDDDDDDDIESAVPPPIARHREHSDAGRQSRVATRRGNLNGLRSSRDRSRSGFSVNKTLKTELLPSSLGADDTLQQPPNFLSYHDHARSLENMRPGSRLSYIDLLVAQDIINPGVRKQAPALTGLGNYAEDIADRNLGEYGGVETEGYDSPHFNNPHSAHHYYSSSKKTEGERGRDRAAVADAGAGAGAGGSTNGAESPDARLDPLHDDEGPSKQSSIIIPDTPHPHPLSPPPPHHHLPPPRPSSSYSQTVYDDTIDPSTSHDRDHARSLRRPNNGPKRSSSLTSDRRKGPSVLAPSAAVIPGPSCHSSISHSRGDIHAHNTPRPLRSPYSSAAIYSPDLASRFQAARPATTSKSVSHTTKQSRERSQSLLTMKETMRDAPLGKRPAGKSVSSGSDVPLPHRVSTTGASVAAASALAKHSSIKIPSAQSASRDRSFPMSQNGNTGGKRSSEAARTLPTPPYSPTSPTDNTKRRSRGDSTSLSTQMDQTVSSIAQSAGSMSTNPSSNREMLVEEASQAPSLEGVVDLNDSVDTDVHTRHAPAVVHEKVIPKVHTITEERVDREIHTHDVFHRIQPIVDVQILPPKHYVQTPDGRGLVEIPTSAIPGRQNHFEVIDTTLKGSTDTGLSAGGVPREQVQHDHSLSDPVISSSKNYVTDKGHPKKESVIRHPPTLETGSYETGQAVPMHMNCLPSECARNSSNQNSIPRRNHGNREEEDLLYKNTGYGEQGMLPGLIEKSPTTGYDGSVGEATSFLRNKKEEKRRTMNSQLNLEEGMRGLNVGK